MLFRHDVDQQPSCAAEDAAFGGTALEWAPGAEALCGEARSFMESMWWTSTFGTRRCGVEPVQRPTALVRSQCIVIWSGVIELRFHEQATRFTVFHELAHAAIAITRQPRRGGHGHEWRTWYLTMISAAYGAGWAERLADSFAASGLSYDTWQ